MISCWLSWSHHVKGFTDATMTKLTVTEYLCHKWPRKSSVCRYHYRIFPHSWRATEFVERVTRRVPQAEHILLVLPEHLSSPPVFSEVLVAQSLVLCVVICRALSVLVFCSAGLCIVCHSIYGFWLPLWCLHTFPWWMYMLAFVLILFLILIFNWILWIHLISLVPIFLDWGKVAFRGIVKFVDCRIQKIKKKFEILKFMDFHFKFVDFACCDSTVKCEDITGVIKSHR